jgi:hypothetical protein
MDRQDVAYVVNTTPKYFYLLPLHFTLLFRYAGPTFKWPIFLATEEPQHPICTYLKKTWPQITILPIPAEQEAFLESRAHTLRLLPSSIEYVLPIQEDFLLEARPLDQVLKEGLDILDECSSVASLRLMPCPGPAGTRTWGSTQWKILEFDRDQFVFVYQATIWRREAYQCFLDELLNAIDIFHAKGLPLTPQQKVFLQIKMNLGEETFGQHGLHQLSNQFHWVHLAWPREGKQPNAVYLSPWPYRPTAVVKGKLEDWAVDLAVREGVPLEPSTR